ncbi:hypothetical protein [Sphingobacterium haloxyli]|uniref:Uncharacterized protein n=1 Tax=Sphingobacterium haloxyli TaxID=2100533 RepID=A0A2S9J060_9SPHI|nr:hypothetical protein [Sphingobacterium haloxyli]PRD46134.1 hypothetical protein C5745_17080 [Sphingobacterium haloxyli]
MKLSEYALKNWNGRNIITTISFKEIKILLLDVNQNMITWELLKNLLAIDSNGNIVWIADLPDSEMFGYYLEIKLNENQLLAWIGGTLCTIDPNTGELLKQQFVK